MYLRVTARRAQRVESAFLAGVLVSFCAASAANAAVVISSAPTQNMSCSAGVCTPTASNANLNLTDLAGMLAAGDTKIISDGAARDIQFAASLSWTSSKRLTLEANHSISFERPIVVAGPGALTVITNDAGSDGDFAFAGKGHIAFWDLASNLVINGTTYTLVKDIRQLAKEIKANPSGFYALANHHQSGATYTQSPIRKTFSGTLNGLGNIISNLTINGSGDNSYVGLFAELDDQGSVRDLRLTNVSVTSLGVATEVGALVGRANAGRIQGVRVEGAVSAPGNQGLVGGVTGYGGYLDNASMSGSVSAGAGALVGGIVGDTVSNITHCHVNATVSADQGEVGGILGAGGSVFSSDAQGSVSGGVAGGIVGLLDGSIAYSYATNSIRGTGAAGGLAGDFQFGAISNSYAMGSVTGGRNSEVGGLVGYKIQNVAFSYSTGTVSALRGSYIGGAIGYDVQTYETGYVYWDLDTSGVSKPHRGAGYPLNDTGITGLADAQLKSGLPKAFDPQIWGQDPKINEGYPYLLANPPQ